MGGRGYGTRHFSPPKNPLVDKYEAAADAPVIHVTRDFYIIAFVIKNKNMNIVLWHDSSTVIYSPPFYCILLFIKRLLKINT